MKQIKSDASLFDEVKVIQLIEKYPKLKLVFNAGLVSRRLCAAVLGITKWDMDDLYIDLVKAGAIKVLSSSAFRATQDTMEVLKTHFADAQFDVEGNVVKK